MANKIKIKLILFDYFKQVNSYKLGMITLIGYFR